MSTAVNFGFDGTEEKSVLLATGSADPYAYLYNIGEVRAVDQLQGFTCRGVLISFILIRTLLN
jgi:hypothetical protein